MKTFINKTGLAAAIAACTMIATPAVANTEGGETISVRYSDLNLATEEGQRVLERRLDNAARQVCQMDDVRVGTRIRSRASEQCYKETRETLARQIATVTAQGRNAG